MQNERFHLGVAFSFALLPTLIVPALFPWLRISFFAPFLILVLYRRPLINALWFSLGSGLILDLLSSHQRLGLHALCACLTIGILAQFKSYLFIEKRLTLPVMTFFFGLLYTLMQLLGLQLFDHGITPSWGWVATDLLFWPLMDGLYGFLWVAIPVTYLSHSRRA